MDIVALVNIVSIFFLGAIFSESKFTAPPHQVTKSYRYYLVICKGINLGIMPVLDPIALLETILRSSKTYSHINGLNQVPSSFM